MPEIIRTLEEAVEKARKRILRSKMLAEEIEKGEEEEIIEKPKPKEEETEEITQ